MPRSATLQKLEVGSMTRKAAVYCLCALLLVQTLGGCASMSEEQKGAAVGAGTGAVVGGVFGAIFGGKKGALIGAAAGALMGGFVGWKVGEYRVQKVKGAEEATAAHKYTSQQGVVAKIDDAAAAPQQLKAGDEITLKTTYTVLAPPEQGQVKVKEVRTIYFNEQELGKLQKVSQLTPGTYASEQPLKLPSDAAEGQYLVKTLVEPVAVEKAVGDQATTAFAVGIVPATSR